MSDDDIEKDESPESTDDVENKPSEATPDDVENEESKATSDDIEHEVPEALIDKETFWDVLGTDGKPVSLKELMALALARPVTAADVDHLFSCHPFIDLCNGDIEIYPDDRVEVTEMVAQSGWLIHDRGDRLTAGPGRLTYGGYRKTFDDGDTPEDEEGGGDDGGTLVIPEGTLIQQGFDTIAELIAMAKERWPAVQIVAGFYPLQRMVWMAGKDVELPVMNFDPSAEDGKLYDDIASQRKGRVTKPLKLKKR